jgi:hypothetical protein
MSLIDNAIDKRLSDYSYNALKESKKKKISNEPQKIIKGKLLDKIVQSSINENAINKKLEQISYSNINGQRQEAKIYAPKGVQMLGQLNREKPLSAITKEMIKDYQEKEAEPKIFVDGEARQYAPGIEPEYPVPFEKLKEETNMIEKWLEILMQRKINFQNNYQLLMI